MRETIQKVLEAEKDAKKLMAAAQSDANRILAEAARKSKELVGEIQEQTRLEAKQIIEQKTSEANAEKSKRLARAESLLETEVQLDPQTRKQAVEAVVRCVCGSD